MKSGVQIALLNQLMRRDLITEDEYQKILNHIKVKYKIKSC